MPHSLPIAPHATCPLQVETGNPFMLYKDSANRKSNQQNLGTIKSSNLCTGETLQCAVCWAALLASLLDGTRMATAAARQPAPADSPGTNLFVSCWAALAPSHPLCLTPAVCPTFHPPSAEIIEYSSAEETAVCNLASIALPRFVREKEPSGREGKKLVGSLDAAGR